MGDVRTLLTFEEFEQIPEKPGKQELLRGEVIELPPADLQHNESSHRLYDALKAALAGLHARGESAALGKVYHEMGYQLPDHRWFQPDVSITHAGQPAGKYLLGAPALAVEIIPESNTAEAIDTKVADYLAHGAIEVWVIYPKPRHMWIYGAGGRAEVCSEVYSGRIALSLLPGVELDLNEILGA
jgi:Uma2 family endonuclease